MTRALRDGSGGDGRWFNRRQLVVGGLSAAAVGAAVTGYEMNEVPVALLSGQSRAKRINSSAAVPRAVEVVIIGGGFVGTSAALTLAERGVSVALCEKGVIAGEASGRSMGYVDSQMLDSVKMELVERSKTIWAGLNQRTGLETGYRPTGLVQELGSEAEAAGAQAWLDSVRGRPQADGKIIRGAELAGLFPGMLNPGTIALYTPSDGSAEPTLAAPAIAEAARQRGAHILQDCAVRGLETHAGRVSGVITEKGAIACQAVVLAAGSWTPTFARSIGISIPQLNIFLSMMGLSSVAGPRVPLSAAGYGFRPQIDGGYTFGVVDFAVPIQPATLRNWRLLRPAINAFWPVAHVGFSPTTFFQELFAPTTWAMDEPSPFEARRVQTPAFREGPLLAALTALREHFPVFRQASVRERWAGIVSSLPDNMPIISPVAQQPGLLIGTGFTYGLTMGPAAGEALADLALGRRPVIDLAPFSLDRFSNGKQLVFRS